MIEQTEVFGNIDREESEYTFLEILFRGLANAKTLDGIVLKGGFLLMNILENSRVTQDIDFSIDKDIGWENLVAAFEVSVASIGSDVCEIVGIRDPQETMSGKIEIKVNSLGKTIGIDASWEPIEIGTKKTNILGLSIDTYTLSHILADKYCVIYSKKRFRRTKDLYDIYNIVSNFDIDYAEFDNVVTHNRNQIDWEGTPMRDDVATEYKKAWDKLSISVIKDDLQSNIKNKPDFKEVFGTVCDFILEYLAYKDSQVKGSKWDHLVVRK